MSTQSAKTLKSLHEKETGLYARLVIPIYPNSSKQPVVSSLKSSANAPVKEVTTEDSQKTPLGCYYGCCLCSPSRLVSICNARIHQVSNLGVNVPHYHLRNPTTSLQCSWVDSCVGTTMYFSFQKGDYFSEQFFQALGGMLLSSLVLRGKGRKFQISSSFLSLVLQKKELSLEAVSFTAMGVSPGNHAFPSCFGEKVFLNTKALPV